MAKKLEDCNHCKGKKMCSKSGGRSCDACLRAAGRGPRDYTTVRCSYCGGRGKVLVETEEEPKQPEAPAEPAEPAEPAAQQ